MRLETTKTDNLREFLMEETFFPPNYLCDFFIKVPFDADFTGNCHRGRLDLAFVYHIFTYLRINQTISSKTKISEISLLSS